MKISTKGRYAVRAMLDLAVNSGGEFIPLKDISKRQNIPVKYMEQIISLFVKAGCLRSTRGKSGGYMLAKPPKSYTIGDILRITEGELSVVSCLEDEVNTCPRSAVCPTLKVWKGLNKVINDYVDSVTLQDLADERISLIGNDYSI